MTQINVLDQAKTKTSNMANQNFIKEKLDEIFVVFGLIFNEEQFFNKFKNNIYQLNNIVQDNSIPTFRTIRVLMEEFEKIMKSQEKEMLMTITAFYYFLYKNFISLYDENFFGNKTISQIPNFVNNSFTQQIPPKFPNYLFPFQVYPNNPFVNYCFNKNLNTNKRTSSLINNEVKPITELKKLSENETPNKENFSDDFSDENKTQKYKLLGKKLKPSELKIVDNLEKYEIINDNKGISNDKPISDKIENFNFNSNAKDRECLDPFSLITEENKEIDRSLLERIDNPVINHLNKTSKREKEAILENHKEEDSKVIQEKIDSGYKNEENKIEETFNEIERNRKLFQDKNLKEIVLEDKQLNENENKRLENIDNRSTILETKQETIDENSNNMVIDNKLVEKNELNTYIIQNEQEEFDKIFKEITNSKSECVEKYSIFHDTNYILESYPNIDEKHIRIFKSGEITNKEEMETMKKIIRPDFLKEYIKCFKNKKDKQKLYYFLTRIHNSKGDEYLMKYDKEAYEFTVFEYIFNK